MKQYSFLGGLALCSLASLWILSFFSFFFDGPSAHMSDLTLHLSILKELDSVVRHGGNPVDFWYDLSPFGYPLFRTYQHIPHLVLYLIYRVLSGAIELEALLRWSTILLACLLPWSVLLGCRLLGFSWVAGAYAGLLSIGISEAGDYGLGLQNFTWGTGGIITQLWGMAFFFPALGFSYQYMFHRRFLGWGLLFTFLTCGSHLVCAVGLALSLAIFFLTSPPLWTRAGLFRLLVYGCGALAITAYQWVVILVDGPYLHRSIHEPLWKFSGHGLSWVIDNFWCGDLFDMARFPSITIAVFIGLSALLFGTAKHSGGGLQLPRLPLLACFIAWILLLCGWDLWGSLMQDTPVLSTFHIHRLIVLVHAFGLFAIAYGVETLFRWPAFALPLLGALLVPIYKERANRMEKARSWYEEALHAQREDPDLSSLVNELKTLPRGYIHVGMEDTWARQLKVGQNLLLRDVLLGEGLQTLSMLYHAYGLSGDVLFDFNPSRQSHYQLFNVRYTVAPSSWRAPPFLELRHQFGRFVLYEYPGSAPLGIYKLTFQVPTSDTPESRSHFMQAWVRSPMVDAKELGLLSNHPDYQSLPTIAQESLNSMPGGRDGTSTLESIDQADAQEYRAHGICSTGDYLLLKTGYHPNWQAALNGQPTATLWVTPGFLAVPCGNGHFSVQLKYQGGTQKLILLGLGLMGGAIITVFCRIQDTSR